MYDEKAVELLRLTISKSEAREMTWEVGDHDAEVFVHKFESGFELRAFPHTEYEPSGASGPPSLSVFDPQGKMILDITVGLPGVDEAEVAHLYQLARRIGEGIEQQLDAVLQELRNTSDIPF